MILGINTPCLDRAYLSLQTEDGRIIQETELVSGKELSEKLLAVIDKMLQEAGDKSKKQETGSKKWEVLNEIKVNTGPGSFTSLRVGVTVANALGLALKIPVNQHKIAVPNYGSATF